MDQFLNPAAFNQPCVLGGTASAPTPIIDQPLGCVPLTGLDALGGAATQVAGPGFSRLDFSLFKNFKLTERFLLQFRSEFFIVLNHPTFQRSRINPGVARLQKSEFWPDWVDSGCSERSETDPVRFEAVLLGKSEMPPEGASGKRRKPDMCVARLRLTSPSLPSEQPIFEVE